MGSPSAFRTVRRLLLFLGLIPLLVACNGSGSSNTSSTSPNAPIIANLRVAYVPDPPVTRQPVQIIFVVDVADANGDWVGGTCAFGTGVVEPIQAPGVPTSAINGTGQCVTSGKFENTIDQVDLAVIDRAGNVSNTLSGSVSLERAAHS